MNRSGQCLSNGKLLLVLLSLDRLDRCSCPTGTGSWKEGPLTYPRKICRDRGHCKKEDSTVTEVSLKSFPKCPHPDVIETYHWNQLPNWVSRRKEERSPKIPYGITVAGHDERDRQERKEGNDREYVQDKYRRRNEPAKDERRNEMRVREYKEDSLKLSNESRLILL